MEGPYSWSAVPFPEPTYNSETIWVHPTISHINLKKFAAQIPDNQIVRRFLRSMSCRWIFSPLQDFTISLPKLYPYFIFLVKFEIWNVIWLYEYLNALLQDHCFLCNTIFFNSVGIAIKFLIFAVNRKSVWHCTKSILIKYFHSLYNNTENQW